MESIYFLFFGSLVSITFHYLYESKQKNNAEKKNTTQIYELKNEFQKTKSKILFFVLFYFKI